MTAARVGNQSGMAEPAVVSRANAVPSGVAVASVLTTAWTIVTPPHGVDA